MNASNSMRDYWFVIFPVVGIGIYSGCGFKKTPPAAQSGIA